ncbi:MAG: sulfur carrier protein ThiS [Myxococcales bacterium FL481]|nr:MAG: sulfur carrier protein ThiS [Myxococcales bacterium FL481]
MVNGESHEADAEATVATLVAKLGLDARQIAVEYNREILPRKDYGATRLADGDILEIVTFVGGG